MRLQSFRGYLYIMCLTLTIKLQLISKQIKLFVKYFGTYWLMCEYLKLNKKYLIKQFMS